MHTFYILFAYLCLSCILRYYMCSLDFQFQVYAIKLRIAFFSVLVFRPSLRYFSLLVRDVIQHTLHYNTTLFPMYMIRLTGCKSGIVTIVIIIINVVCLACLFFFFLDDKIDFQFNICICTSVHVHILIWLRFSYSHYYFWLEFSE